MPLKPTGIEFLRPWRGRPTGRVDSGLDYGVAQLLVQRGIARWHSGGEMQEPQQRSKQRGRAKLVGPLGD